MGYEGNIYTCDITGEQPTYTGISILNNDIMTYQHICSDGTYHYLDDIYPKEGENIMKIFTIENQGNADLNITTIGISGDTAFTIDQTGTETIIVPGANTTFKVTFQPTTVGAKTASVSIINNDDDENPYIINVIGEGIMAQEINVKVDGVDVATGGTVDFGSVIIG